jgi:hypothetical protein
MISTLTYKIGGNVGWCQITSAKPKILPVMKCRSALAVIITVLAMFIKPALAATRRDTGRQFETQPIGGTFLALWELIFALG